MISRWDEKTAAGYAGDPLQMRVYTSRLLGEDPSLVLHGGGNTSVKTTVRNLFGEDEEVLYVKGSGWDLATIEAAGFAPVKLDVLKKMAGLAELTDHDMVKYQRAAMLDPSAPNPSVEAILHAVIPFNFVDHTHADAIVTVTNTDGGEARIREIYGERILIVPYVMPGFILAKTVYEMTRDTDWSKLEGIVLMNHGIFSFHDDAQESYERMIRLVGEAEAYIEANADYQLAAADPGEADLLALATLRREVSLAKGAPMLAKLVSDEQSVGFSRLADGATIATRGPLTPDHVIRTKRIPLIMNNDIAHSVAAYGDEYRAYFERNRSVVKGGEGLTMLDPAPRWAIWPGLGRVAFGASAGECNIIDDITRHTIAAEQKAEGLGGWRALPEKDIFEVEYWELEQAKLKKGGSVPPFKGRVAIVTGAASGIGRACVNKLLAEGAAVVASDINPDVADMFKGAVMPVVGDVTDMAVIQSMVVQAVSNFGGLDVVISNAGIFPSSCNIADMDDELWQKSMDVNLTSHRRLFTAAAPYLKVGIDPAIVVIASKNVPAPGPGAAAYSAAKAGLTQLARVAAFELGPDGVRVNVLHPNAVFDTGVWTEDVLIKRAASYGKSVEEYKRANVLGVEVSSMDVADLAAAMAGPLFSKTTGAQLPIDGGNDRVI